MKALTIIAEMGTRGFLWGGLAGPVSGLFGGFPIFGIGGIFGFFLGLAVGPVVGAIIGTISGIVTVAYFNPLHKTSVVRYRIVVVVVCVILTIVATYIAVLNLFNNFTNSRDVDLYRFLYLPAVTTLAALFASAKLATWYISHSKA